jgi:hypothetical protein
MNKHSATKKRSAKPSRSRVPERKPVRRRATVRRVARQAEPNGAIQVVAAVSVSQITAITSSLHSHKFRVGQTVFYTSSPISRPGATGSYKVVRLLPSDGDDYQYRIKNPGEAFERVAKESQLELEN